MNFLSGFNLGFTNGMFNNMFGFAPFGGIGFCNWNMPLFNFGMPANPFIPTFMPINYNMNFFSCTPANYQIQTFSYNNTCGCQNYVAQQSPICYNQTPAPCESIWSSPVTTSANCGCGDSFTKTTSTVTTEKQTKDEKSNTSKSSTPKSETVKTTQDVKVKHWSKMTDNELKIIYGNYDRDVRTKYKGTAADLNRYLKGKGILEGLGEEYIKAQEKYGINAAVLVAITILESGHGKDDRAVENKNVGGVRSPGSTKLKKYNCVCDCIDDMARFLSKGYINNPGRPLTHLYQINAKYCPCGDPTDKSRCNNTWASKVEKITTSVEKTA